MTPATIPAAAELLVKLGRLDVRVAIEAGRVRLHPASRIPRELLEDLCAHKGELLAMLSDPRQRWRSQADVLVADVPADDREDLLHLFDEREAIASVDGGLDDHDAGRLAYDTLCDHLREQNE